MKIQQLNNLLNKLFPYKKAELWDKVGLFDSKFIDHQITNIIISLDVDYNTIKFAKKNHANVIISHHPLYIDDNVASDNYYQKIINYLNKNEISLMSLHTNYDLSKKGMNYNIAKKLNLKKITTIKDTCGIIAELKNSMRIDHFLDFFNQETNIDFFIKKKIDLDKTINKIYLGAGSCASEIYKIINNNMYSEIDLFLTGDIKWNYWVLFNDLNIDVIDIGHNIEYYFIDHLFEILKENGFKNLIKFDFLHLSTYH